MKRLADTGLIVALLARDDPFHEWALRAFREHAPYHTCEAVLVEAASFFPTPLPVLTLVARADLVLDPDFSLANEMPRVQALCHRYADRPMDLADACIVRMTEMTRRCKVWTVDRHDFAVYRRNGRERIPHESPTS
jgi:predicted nucleic acid-binding protein